ncbi:YjgB family protein [Shimazuella sp. AN120528]|uniref:DUF4309 domain-containing protein n=1 Tax=Shimazuella soli TaxID=1892854 RepID=UPI001F0E3E14|nr:DUF4309 domain-containing protein [Shimazuella soli]MCH5583476.1 YjgB family protein [Shimazuella soli]
MKRKMIGMILVITILGLTGCTINVPVKTNTSETQDKNRSNTAPQETPSEKQDSNQTDPNQNASNSNQDSTPANKPDGTQQLIQQVKQLAIEGKTINSDGFGLGSSRDEINKKWGAEDKEDVDQMYYESRKAYFVLKNDKVVELYSADERLQNITKQEVQNALGKPDQLRQYEDGDELIYKAGDNSITFTFGSDIEIFISSDFS